MENAFKIAYWIRCVMRKRVSETVNYLTVAGTYFIPEEQMQGLEAYGYPGIFLLSIIANATVLIPAPGILFVFILGAKLPPLWVGIAAGLGATIGE